MTRFALACLAASLASTAASAGPLPYETARAPLDVPPAYVLEKQVNGPELHPGASFYASGCQWRRSELIDDRGFLRVFRVPVCL